MRFLIPAIAVVLAGGAIISVQRTEAQSNPMPLKGKVVLVTGSTDGLGREVALRSAALGANVIVHGRNQERGKAVVAEIEKLGRGGAKFYAADFASMEAVRQSMPAASSSWRD